MFNLSSFYKELLESNIGDVTIKLMDDKEVTVVSYIICKHSSVFKMLLESGMKESESKIVDLSKHYGIDAFSEFLNYIYYGKTYDGHCISILFELLQICDFFDVQQYRANIEFKIKNFVDGLPMCLVIAKKALKRGQVAKNIYDACILYLIRKVKPFGGYLNKDMKAFYEYSELPNFIIKDLIKWHETSTTSQSDDDDKSDNVVRSGYYRYEADDY